MKTISQLVADIDAITAEFSAVPEKDNKEAFEHAEEKYLRTIFPAEVALANYRPRNYAELTAKIEALFALQDVKDAFDTTPVMKAWRKTLLRDVAAVAAETPKQAA